MVSELRSTNDAGSAPAECSVFEVVLAGAAQIHEAGIVRERIDDLRDPIGKRDLGANTLYDAVPMQLFLPL